MLNIQYKLPFTSLSGKVKCPKDILQIFLNPTKCEIFPAILKFKFLICFYSSLEVPKLLYLN